MKSEKLKPYGPLILAGILLVIWLLEFKSMFSPAYNLQDNSAAFRHFEKLVIDGTDMAEDKEAGLISALSNKEKASLSFALKEGWILDGIYVYGQSRTAGFKDKYPPKDYRQKLYFGQRAMAKVVEGSENTGKNDGEFSGIQTGNVRTYYYFDISNTKSGEYATLIAVTEKYNTLILYLDGATPGETKLKFTTNLFISRTYKFVRGDEDYDPAAYVNRNKFTTRQEFCDKFFGNKEPGLFASKEDLCYADGNTAYIKFGIEYNMNRIEMSGMEGVACFDWISNWRDPER